MIRVMTTSRWIYTRMDRWNASSGAWDLAQWFEDEEKFVGWWLRFKHSSPTHVCVSVLAVPRVLLPYADSMHIKLLINKSSIRHPADNPPSSSWLSSIFSPGVVRIRIMGFLATISHVTPGPNLFQRCTQLVKFWGNFKSPPRLSK
jgi:hypothetical protein